MPIKKAIFKVDNGTTYDEIVFKTTADQVFFSDDSTFQSKLDNGLLVGPTGPTGKDGLTTSVTVNSNTYVQNEGNITLPDYPTLTSLDAASSSHKHSWGEINGTPPVFFDTNGNSLSLNKSSNTASGTYAISMGYGSRSSGNYSFSSGYQTIAQGYGSHTEGYADGPGALSAYGKGSHAEGINCIAGTSKMSADSATASHAEGYSTKASAQYCHSEGYGTSATSMFSHAEGQYTTASGMISHSEGGNTTASGAYSHAEGYYSISSGSGSHAQNYYCISAGYSQTAIGKYNLTQGTSSSSVSTDSAFIIGNGTADATASRSNAFRVTWAGLVYSKGAYSTTGADYAEMFEWYDGNANNEDRLGHFITFEKRTGKIRIANSNDKYILGVVSSTAAIIGDNYDEDWKNKYITDKWGRIQYQIVNVVANIDDSKTEQITQEVPILNPNYNIGEYTPRKDRKEWDAIGLIGKLLVYNDGTCEIGDFCMPNDDGIATKSDTGYYVIDKYNDLVKILFK